MTSPSVKAERVPAYTFSYPLDTFQSESIEHLENGDSVLVSAHTSAGKTTVALYAIAMHLRAKRRVIYTSPIKALSNQKFREFQDTFGNAGLMTGDTTVKPSADCLVMTTEILRSMLYRGTEMLREVGCVIFDEVHYMRDKARGVVWEETIILLPEKCQYVFLSATIPNGQQFADWVMHIHPGLKCHVVYTDKRPVPLRHYVFPQGGPGLFQIVDENKFSEEQYSKAFACLSSEESVEANAGMTDGGNARKKRRSDPRAANHQAILQVMNHVILNNMHPCIVFVFAKAECEVLALALSKTNFNTEEEEKCVTETYQNAIDNLSEDDRKLPAVQQLMPLLQRGVGIHHSGLLPILKEVVELLFQAGLVKCLFSTETFSMGLNMPARTVVFSNVRKFDGTERRYLTSGEYIQMSGRAGRRGLDRHGVTIIIMEEPIDTAIIRSMTVGGADKLNSSFHLTYNMILNLLRVEDADPTYMMMRSFYQFQHEGNRPVLEGQLNELQAKLDSISVDHLPECQQYWTCVQQLDKLLDERHRDMITPATALPFLQCGRIVKVHRRTTNQDYGWGVVVRHYVKAADIDTDLTAAHAVEVLVAVRSDMIGQFPDPPPEDGSVTVDFAAVSFDLDDIDEITKLRMPVPDDHQFPLEERNKMHKNLKKVVARQKKSGESDGTLPLMHPIADMKIANERLVKTIKRIEALQNLLEKNPLSQASATSELKASYSKYELKKSLEVDVKQVQEELEKLKHVVLTEELQKMMRVLRRLDYIDENNIIQRKGKIACEITTADQDELLLTELLFRGVFNDMEIEMIAAVLSCLVNVHKTPDNFDPEEKFHAALRQLYDVNARIHKVCQDAGLIDASPDGSESTGAERVMPSLVEVTYRWAKGAKFSEIVASTDAFEGDIVRMMRRLEELMRQLASAARSPAVGSQALHDKLMQGILLIKRDVVFAGSLYL